MTKQATRSNLVRRGAEKVKLYRGLRGKVVDFFEHQFDEGRLYIHIRFRDKTEITFTLGSKLLIHSVELSDVSTGNLKPIREYVRYQE